MTSLQLTTSCLSNQVSKITCSSPSCGQPSLSTTAPYIVGGDVAIEGQWPWSVALLFNGDYRCSAVLIDTYWVLSAAHCFYNANNGYSMTNVPQYFSLRLGTTKRLGSSPHLTIAGISRIIAHPQYTHTSNNYQYNDLALIQLNQPVTFDSYISPICLPSNSPRGALCYAIGWGLTALDQCELSFVDIVTIVKPVTNHCYKLNFQLIIRSNQLWIVSFADSDPAVDLRQAKMQVWPFGQCDQTQYWGRQLNSTTQLCAGYTNGYITMCQVHSTCLTCQFKMNENKIKYTVHNGNIVHVAHIISPIIWSFVPSRLHQGSELWRFHGELFTRIYQDPSRLTTVGHHGWPSAGGNKCLKIPPHVPQVMIKLPLECIHWPHSNHIIIQPVPLLAHPCKLDPPNIQPVPSLEQREAMPSSTIVSHNPKKTNTG